MPKKTRTAPVTATPPLEGEHIFPASVVTPLAVKWKELYAAGRHKEAMRVLEEVVEHSTAMFERLAQFEDFHYTVDLPILVSAAQEKVVKWLIKWQPKKGRLFSWFSKCAKNAFRSELVKVNQYRRRFHVTSDNLEKFYGVDDHEVDRHDLAKEVRSRLHSITCRWGDPQEIGAIRFILECICDDEHDKQASIRTASYAYGLSPELAKFFYNWCVVELRHAMYDKVHVPITEQDLMTAALSYDYLPGLLDIMPFDTIKKLIGLYGGMRLKIPTLNFFVKLRQDHAIYLAIDRSAQDPESVAEVARKFKRTPRSAQEIFNQMTSELDPIRTGEYDVYGDSGHQADT
jgi:hypothetical protein